MKPRIQAHLQALEQGLLQRDTAVRLVLLAALAGEHVLLIGPPGTAKSELARRLHRTLADAAFFERLLTRFSTPEELFGPLSLKALEDDRYERLTQGFLPTAGIAFLDEVFKANSAILNALLTLLNEREFDNGAGRVRTPLLSVVAASNELPDDEALLAFQDRFLLRVPVAPVDDAHFVALLRLAPGRGSPPALPAAPFTRAELEALRARAAQVRLSDEALAGLQALRGVLAARACAVSDRRWRQWMALMRVAAAAEGRDAVDRLDLWLAPYVATLGAEDGAAVQHWFEADWLGAVPRDAPWLTQAVVAFEQQLEIERSAPGEDATDGGAGKLALARAIGAGQGGADGEGPLRLQTRALEAHLRRRYSPVHLAARVAQLQELIAGAQAQREQVAQELAGLCTALAGRLWLPTTLSQRLQAAHAKTLAVLDALLARAEACRAGFAALPQDEALPPQVPAPLRLPAAEDAVGAA